MIVVLKDVCSCIQIRRPHAEQGPRGVLPGDSVIVLNAEGKADMMEDSFKHNMNKQHLEKCGDSVIMACPNVGLSNHCKCSW